MTLCSDEKPKLYPGAWVSALQVTDAYIIEDFPIQAGQGSYKWLPPYNEYDVVSQGAELRDTLDGGRTFIGNQTSVLGMVLQTSAQLDYWVDTVMDGQASRRATMYRFNRRINAWETVWVILRDRLFADQFQPSAGGTQKYELDVLTQQTAPEAPALALDINPSTTLPSSSGSLTFTFTVDNTGDYQTFDDITVIGSLPSNALWGFVGVSQAGWDVSYSTNGGGSYASTLPSPPNLTTNIQAIYEDPVGVGSDVSFIVQGTMAATGTVTIWGTASHPMIASAGDYVQLIAT